MAQKCDICGKGRSVGMQVSHSHIRTKKTWSANLQPVKALINGTPKKIKVCTRCLRSGNIVRNV